jgi:hypothetical protein
VPIGIRAASGPSLLPGVLTGRPADLCHHEFWKATSGEARSGGRGKFGDVAVVQV